MKKLSLACSLLAVGLFLVWAAIQAHSVIGYSQIAQNKEEAEVELITITPDGFFPSEIKRVNGNFLLVVNDHSGLSETVLSFDRIVGNSQKEKVKEQNVQRSQPLWTEEHKLQPGEYVLTEASHPNWKCLVIISAK